MNIGPAVDTLSQVKQAHYIDLKVDYGELTPNTQLRPLGLPECSGNTDCNTCPNLVRDTAGKVQTVYQYNDPMAATCGATAEHPLVYMEFKPTRH